jgi:putative membrane protein insertion efficiency factor
MNQRSGDTFDIDASPQDAVFIQRHFCGHTLRDLEIRDMSMPARPVWLIVVVRLLRFYRGRIAPHLGNRCVFDPSCSHYAEVAFRKKGFYRGFLLTLRRLTRCRPGNGGTDEV